MRRSTSPDPEIVERDRATKNLQEYISMVSEEYVWAREVVEALKHGADPNTRLSRTKSNYLQTVCSPDFVYKIYHHSDLWDSIFNVLDVFLRDKRFDIYYRNGMGESTIHILAALKDPKFLIRLCEVPNVNFNEPIQCYELYGEQINTIRVGINGDTALHIACHHRDYLYERVEALLRCGARVDTFNSDNLTPVHVLVSTSHFLSEPDYEKYTSDKVRTLRLLYKNGLMKPNYKTMRGGPSVLQSAILSHDNRLGTVRILKALLDLGEDPTQVVESSGKTAMEHAKEAKFTEAYELFKEWRIQKAAQMRWALKRQSVPIQGELADKMVIESYYTRNKYLMPEQPSQDIRLEKRTKTAGAAEYLEMQDYNYSSS